MKKKKIFIFIYVALLSLVNVFSVNASAKQEDFLDVYIETEYIVEKKKVYLTDDLVSVLQKSNLEILDEPETKGWWIFKETIHHYYYMASNYIDEIVSFRKIDGTMDTLVYMVKQVESYAFDYKLNNKSSKSINDLVLGYLRCINTDYLDASSIFDGLQRMGYKVLCNNYEQI